MVIEVDNRVLINNYNLKKYLGLGYNCKQGDVLELPIEHLQTKTRIIFSCENCGIEKETDIKAFLLNKKCFCNKCASINNPQNQFIDLTGQKFGRLTAIENIKGYKKDKAYWKCSCDCGNESVVFASSLKNGDTKSCGCFKEEKMVGDTHPSWNPNITEEERANKRPNSMQELGQEVFKRDNYTCIICENIGGKLNAHHVIPWSMSKELREDINNLITMCECCHKQYHSMYKLKNINLETLTKFKELCILEVR